MGNFVWVPLNLTEICVFQQMVNILLQLRLLTKCPVIDVGENDLFELFNFIHVSPRQSFHQQLQCVLFVFGAFVSPFPQDQQTLHMNVAVVMFNLLSIDS